jgi:hypothetical protein
MFRYKPPLAWARIRRCRIPLTAARWPISVRLLMARFAFFVIVIELPTGAGGGGALS